MSKINRYTRAMRQIRTPLAEAPTNSMQGIYVDTPFTVTTPPPEIIQGQGADYTQDADVNGQDTSGLFDANGDQLTAVPPETVDSPDNSYILGPMASMWYAWGNFTTIGYIREADRKMVNLASITGPLHTWDRSTGFNSYGQLTLEQALWFVDNPKYGGVDNDYANANYRAFYPGPPSSTTDQYGRYLCTITGVPKQEPGEYQPPDDFTPGSNVSGDDEKSPLRNIVPGSAKPKDEEDEEGDDKEGDDKEGKDTEKDPQKEAEVKDQKDKEEKEAESLMDKLKDHWKEVWDDITNHDDIVEFGKDLVNMIDDVTDKIPALEYSKDIAQSILENKPRDESANIPPEHVDKLINNINYDNITVAEGEPKPYADDNFITDKDGNVRPRAQWPTDENGNDIMGDDLKKPENRDKMNAWFKDHKENPPNTGPVQNEESGKQMEKDNGRSNPLAAAGQAQTQIVFPDDGSEPYFRYEDHAYHNVESKDPGEVPGIGIINPKQWISGAVHAVADMVHGRQAEKNKAAASSGEFSDGPLGVPKSDYKPPNTGGMEGYPPNIRGDVIKIVEKPYSELPPKMQKFIDSKRNKKNESYIGKYRRRKLLKEVKQPYVMPEEKKVKLTGYRPKLPNRDKMRQIADSMNVPDRVTYAKAQTGTWQAGELERGRKSSQAKKNEVLELLGQGEDSWVYMTETSRKKSAKAMYENFTLMNEQGVGTYKISRKEPLRSDYVVFLEYEDGTKSTMLQSELNEKMSDQSEKWRKDWKEPIKYEDQPAYKKVKKILSKEIPLKDIQPEFPKKAPPKLDPETQMHPDMYKRHDYFTKLDPDSAKTMAAAPTGNPEIDAEVEKAKKKPK